MAKVTLKNIWKKFGTLDILKGINLDIDDGEFVVLVGPSGCGKSTLLNLIAGLETITSGDILIGERQVNTTPPKNRDIAMVFQSYALYPTKTVRSNITFGMETRGVPKDEQNAAVDDVSQLLHVDHLLDRKPGQLSGGQRQRVAMGRALVREPAVFLFDEPLSNLDAKLRIEMRTEIKKLHQRLGKTMIYVTHDQIEAMTLASRIAVMDAGHIRQFASPAEIYDDPADLFVAGFMGSPSMNMIRGTVVLDGGAFVKVDDKDGEILFPLNDTLAKRVKDKAGHEVILGLRPENITHVGAHGSDTKVFNFERHVDVIEPTGPDTLLIFGLSDIEAVARVRPEENNLPLDKPYRFEVNMAKAKLFDPETGKKL